MAIAAFTLLDSGFLGPWVAYGRRRQWSDAPRRQKPRRIKLVFVTPTHLDFGRGPGPRKAALTDLVHSHMYRVSFWVALKDLHLSYYIAETKLITIHIHIYIEILGA